MWKNYLKIAWRNVLRNKLRTFIHVLGLSIGIAVSFLIFNIVFYSYSFDGFHPDGERIYRVQTVTKWQEFVWDNPGATFHLADALRESFTGLEEVGHLYTLYNVESSLESGKTFERSDWISYASPDFFKVFPRDWLVGHPEEAMKEPFQVVLTASRAEFYFPGLSYNEILGKQITYQYRDTVVAQVAGVVADFNQNTDFQFSDYISISTLDRLANAKRYHQDWNSVNSSNQVFVKLMPSCSPEEISSLLELLVDQKMEKDENGSTTLYLFPLSEIHFNQTFNNLTANKEVLNGLVIIAILLILMACLNFINLETAHAINRSREVGIRKTLGSSRWQLLSQFLIETFVYVWISILVSFVLINLISLYFKDFFPYGLEIIYFSTSNILFMLGLSIALSLLSGFYPAWIMGRYSAHEALKKGWATNGGSNLGIWFRRNLTTIQFAISILFIIGILVIYQQMNFIRNKDLGFDKDQVMFVRFPYGSDSTLRKQMEVQIEKLAFVENVSWSSNLISERAFWSSGLEFERDSIITEYNVEVKNADINFGNVNGIRIKAGRYLEQGGNECVVNMQLVSKLGFGTPEDALGQRVNVGEEKLIVGVLEDFHSLNLKMSINPLIIEEGSFEDYSMLNIRLNEHTSQQMAKQQIDAVLLSFPAKDKLSAHFLDDVISDMYQEEAKTGKVLIFATIITIIIACLGLFGLASWHIQRRLKEISIRKVLGATLMQILSLVSKEYLYLLMVSALIGGSLAWYLSDQWLGNFAYRISMPWMVFLLATLFALLLSLAIVCFHALRAASKDPAEILKSE